MVSELHPDSSLPLDLIEWVIPATKTGSSPCVLRGHKVEGLVMPKR